MSSTLISQQSNRQTALSKQLKQLLANTYVIYVKTQNFHWNLLDREFVSLHKFFENQYEELADAVDELAERVRILGEASPGTMQEFLRLATLKEAAYPSIVIQGIEAITALLCDHQTIVEDLKESISQFAEAADPGTADLLTQRLRSHEKTVWMLHSHLNERTKERKK